eukprot:Tamp_24665.p1 GENE.Tamp_24665~~Tamp_24665.p1  ORF type:complete len:165 (-),score=25.85 Tamp_24665:483-950(-)
MSPSGDQLVTRISGGASSQSGPGPLGGLPGVQSPYGAGAALRGGAGGDAGEMMMNPYPGAGLMAKLNEDFNVWLMTGGANRLMGESCIFKGCLAYGAGGGLGLAFGAFMAPFDTMNGLKVAENATAKETAVATIHQTRTKAVGMGRTFAVLTFRV